MSKIRFFVTGGTIDKVYNEIDGTLGFVETHIPAMLEQSRCKLDLEIETLMLKDSLEMDYDDRALIYRQCEDCEETRIVISHGTDTMVETAEVLADIADKTIVLFGAMVPWTISHSDSLFNLGCAITAVQTLDSGVYITMNGKIFVAGEVTKNRTAGVFELKSN